MQGENPSKRVELMATLWTRTATEQCLASGLVLQSGSCGRYVGTNKDLETYQSTCGC